MREKVNLSGNLRKGVRKILKDKNIKGSDKK